MEVIIRQEKPSEYATVSEIIKEAFQIEPPGDQTEHLLVEKLRRSEAFIPQLSLVAEIDEKLVGYILLTKIHIVDKEEKFESLAMAPVAVRPEFQRQGIGAKLIYKAHEVARRLGYSSVVLIGYKAYYPRFGYHMASKYGIELPFEAPPENCMVLELRKGALEGVSGMVEYPEAFFN